MMTQEQFRDNLADILRESFHQSGLGLTELEEKSGLSSKEVANAFSFGRIDAADLVQLTRALGLDAGAALSQACHNPAGDNLELEAIAV